MQSPPAATATLVKLETAGHRHHLTLLFADLCDSTGLAAHLEAEHYAELIAALARLYVDVVTAHGGIVNRIQGDGVLAVFGYPLPHEDDGRRATEAALALHRAVRSLRLEGASPGAPALQLHSGIHSGLCLVKDGDPARGRFELLGHAPNVAAKLAAAAGRDEVLVSEDAVGPGAARFLVAGRRALSLDPATPQVTALHVVGHARERAPAAAASPHALAAGAPPALAGRARELQVLRDALADVGRGARRQIALQGAAGIGKSRVVRTFLDSLQDSDVVVLAAACDGVTSAQALDPFAQMMRSVLKGEARLGSAGASLAAALRDLLGRQASEELLAGRGPAPLLEPAGGGQPALHSLLGEWLSAVARHHRLVLFIDDWHWADDASHRLLETLSSTPAADAPAWLWLLTTRRFGGRAMAIPGAFEPLEVPPLAPQACRETIRRLVPGVDPFLSDRIAELAGGNPLYVEELCHRVRRDGALPPAASPSEGWLGALIGARVGGLPDRQAALVRQASVLGHTMPVWLYEHITGCAGDADDTRALAAADLLFPGEQPATLQFKHAITRDVIYRAVDLHERRATHHAAASALRERAGSDQAADECSEALSHHYSGAGDHALAAHHAEVAARRAMRMAALDRAQAYYRAVLDALDRLPPTPDTARRWCSAAQGLGLACVFDPSRDDLPLFERAIAQARAADDPALLARATYWLGYVRYALGDQRAALARLRTAGPQAAHCGDGPLQVQVQASLAQTLTAAGHNDEALQLLDAAVASKQAHRSGRGNAVGLVYSLTTQGMALADLGRFGAADEAFGRAFALLGTLEHPVAASAHGVHAAALLWQGRWAEARAAATRAQHVAQRVRSLFTLTMGAAAGAYAHWMQTGAPAARRELEDAAEWLLPRGNLLFRSLILGWLADMHAHAGAAETARTHAVEALRRARQRDMLGAPMACRAMARVAAQQSDMAAAQRWLARARRMAARRNAAHEQATNLLCKAQLAASLGHADGAALARRAREAFTVLGMDWHAEQAAALAR